MAESIQAPEGFLKVGMLINDGEMLLDEGAIAVKREGWKRPVYLPLPRIRYYVLA
jgi:hypothetical protein